MYITSRLPLISNLIQWRERLWGVKRCDLDLLGISELRVRFAGTSKNDSDEVLLLYVGDT